MKVGLDPVRSELKHLPQSCRGRNVEMSFPETLWDNRGAHEKDFARDPSFFALSCEVNSSSLLNVLAKSGVYLEVEEVDRNS